MENFASACHSGDARFQDPGGVSWLSVSFT